IPLSPPGADAAVHAAHRGCTRAALADAASRPRRLLQRLRGRRDRSTSTGSAFSPVGYGPVMSDGVTLGHAVETAATGDVWLFRGKSLADLAIRTVTNAPVNHVGMVVALDDLPPLLWHAELGRSLPDVWSGQRQRGVQLHLLRDAVRTWHDKYGQRAWMRQLDGEITREHEDRLVQAINQFDGRSFPSTLGLARPWSGRFSGSTAASGARRRSRRSTAPSSSRRPTSTWDYCRATGRRAGTTRANSGAATRLTLSLRSASAKRFGSGNFLLPNSQGGFRQMALS